MAKPTITYGHATNGLIDCDDASDWTTETLSNMLGADATLSVMHNDIFKIQADFDDASTIESVFYENATPLNINHVLNTKWLLRYKTSHGSNGAQAKVEARFQDGTTETLLPLSYNDTWTVLAGVFTKATSELDYIRFYAQCETSTPNGTYYVYYDFVLVHEGTFTFPHVAPGGITLHLVPKTAKIEIPGRDGDIIQRLGMKSPVITLKGDMRAGETWGTSSFSYGEYLYRIIRDSDPWQWLTTDRGNFPVTIDPTGCEFGMTDDAKAQCVYTLNFVVTKLSSLGEITWNLRQWYGK